MNLPTSYDGCGKKFMVYHSLLCPKGVLVLVRHDGVSKEWYALGAWVLIPSTISYKPHINSKMVRW